MERIKSGKREFKTIRHCWVTALNEKRRHTERSEASHRIPLPFPLRWFAEFILSEVEGLTMTMGSIENRGLRRFCNPDSR